jgi:predicted Ser/Thr protein kinase
MDLSNKESIKSKYVVYSSPREILPYLDRKIKFKKDKGNTFNFAITVGKILILVEGGTPLEYTFEEAFERFEYVDGTPFGEWNMKIEDFQNEYN